MLSTSGLSGIHHRVSNPHGWKIGFSGADHAGSQQPIPVPFFSEVREEVTRSWTATVWCLFFPHYPLWWVAKGYMEIPQWTVLRRCNCVPRPPGMCKFSSPLLGVQVHISGHCHLWLNLADMREPDQVQFLNAPVRPASLETL